MSLSHDRIVYPSISVSLSHDRIVYPSISVSLLVYILPLSLYTIQLNQYRYCVLI